MHKILHFIKYHNAFTIIFVVVFFGFGIGYAASPQVRDSVYSSTETVVSVDNGLMVSTDLDNFNFNLKVNSITEDEKNYYVVYSYQTLAIVDGFWQTKEIEKTLTVNKEALGGKDLELYVTEELGENIRYELSYLKRVQKLEKEKGESQKVVAVEYSGLIGKFIDPKEIIVEEYPVIPEPEPEIVVAESNQAAVVLSIPDSQPSPEPTPEPEVESASVLEPDPEPAPEVSTESGPEFIATSTPQQEQATSTPVQTEPAEEATSTPERIEPAPEPAPEPEPESEPEPASAPDAGSSEPAPPAENPPPA